MATVVRPLLLTLLLSLAGALSAQPSASVADAEEALRADLASIVADAPGRDARYGVLVVSLDRGDTLFALRPAEPLVPASNAKLFSTAAALHYLGPRFRWRTWLLADGPVRGGVLEGDLVLAGTGDPTLAGRLLPSADSLLEALADTLLARGVRSVRGDVVGDASFLDQQWIAPGWQPDDLDRWYGAPSDALLVDEALATLRIGPRSAEPVRPMPGLALERRSGPSGAPLHFGRAGGRLAVEGRTGATVTRTVPVADPANHAAARLLGVLRARGIEVAGRARTEQDPAASALRFHRLHASSADDGPRVLAVHLSPPLSEVIRQTNHLSHNLFADLLLKTVGRVAEGEGSWEAGARAALRLVEESGADEGARLLDGSGLSRDDRLAPRALVALLARMADGPHADVFAASLPAAADTTLAGSLRHRMAGTAAAGRLRAKTGTLRGVSSLSGYVLTADGERLAFSIVGNGLRRAGDGKRIEDRIGARLAEFRRE